MTIQRVHILAAAVQVERSTCRQIDSLIREERIRTTVEGHCATHEVMSAGDEAAGTCTEVQTAREHLGKTTGTCQITIDREGRGWSNLEVTHGSAKGRFIDIQRVITAGIENAARGESETVGSRAAHRETGAVNLDGVKRAIGGSGDRSRQVHGICGQRSIKVVPNIVASEGCHAGRAMSCEVRSSID